MAKKEYFTFLSSDKKTKIHGVSWTPESGEYTAVLQICHGMTEYVERYQEFAAYMTEHGYLVVGHDHLGHGDSVRSREDWGYIADERGEQYMIADIHKVRKITQRENPGLPYFILGHSMGSYLLRKYITRYGEGLSGAIIVGTGSVPDVVLKTGMRTAECIALLKGWRHRSRLMEKLVFSGSFRKFSMGSEDPENNWLTKDVSRIEKYYGEPRCSFHFTLNGFYNVMKVVSFDNQMKYMNRIPKDLPIVLLSGENDPVGDLGRGVKRVEKQLRKAGIQDLYCKLYANDRHEILNETDRDVVYGDILAWCEKRKTV
ncbi:MAG: alpha/beta hydrolase [Lachnospiraceae bacterium]|jgi:alpha-beta hydrolase superfamily lysophospholipase|nr:alpha/beta hydrolase [Lachnospiraceae bacterium]